MTDLQRRGPGRPKGTKNKPDAKAGRPRKDTQNYQQKKGNSRTGKSLISTNFSPLQRSLLLINFF
jgi:hypothetical protein